MTNISTKSIDKNCVPTSSNSTSSDGCVICLTQLHIKTTLKLPCEHIFHNTCIFEWMQISRNCPLCSRKVNVWFFIRNLSKHTLFLLIKSSLKSVYNNRLLMFSRFLTLIITGFIMLDIYNGYAISTASSDEEFISECIKFLEEDLLVLQNEFQTCPVIEPYISFLCEYKHNAKQMFRLMMFLLLSIIRMLAIIAQKNNELLIN